MSRIIAILLFAILPATLAHAGVERDYAHRKEVRLFAQAVAREKALPEDWIMRILGEARRRDSILKAMMRPAESKPWYEYRPIFVNPARIDGGVAYWKNHARLLAQVRERFGVDIPYIVAIIGVETRYGQHTGRYRVLDALATLAFDYPPRAPFFRQELGEFLTLVHEEDIDPLSVKGSYAGAMGHGQFMPSSYRRYAVDFDGDGVRNLWDSDPDILASVANYLHRHGWQAGGPVAVRARVQGEGWRPVLEAGMKPHLPLAELTRLGVITEGDDPIPGKELASLIRLQGEKAPEYWVVFNNFHVITRYNRSPLYAMAVHQLAEAIREAYEEESYSE